MDSTFNSNLTYNSDNELIEKLKKKLLFFKNISEPQPKDISILLKVLEFILGRYRNSSQYGEMLLRYLDAMEKLKQKCYDEQCETIYEDIFLKLTSICGEALSVRHLQQKLKYLTSFINLWILLTRTVSNPVKIRAFTSTPNVFKQLVFVMKKTGDSALQIRMIELIIRYCCSNFNNVVLPTLIEIFESNSLKQARDLLEQFNFRSLRKSIDIFLRNFNNSARTPLLTVHAEDLTLKCGMIPSHYELIRVQGTDIDFNLDTSSISFSLDASLFDQKAGNALMLLKFSTEHVSEVIIKPSPHETELAVNFTFKNSPLVSPSIYLPHMANVKEIEINFMQLRKNVNCMQKLIHEWFSKKLVINETSCSEDSDSEDSVSPRSIVVTRAQPEKVLNFDNRNASITTKWPFSASQPVLSTSNTNQVQQNKFMTNVEETKASTKNINMQSAPVTIPPDQKQEKTREPPMLTNKKVPQRIIIESNTLIKPRDTEVQKIVLQKEPRLVSVAKKTVPETILKVQSPANMSEQQIMGDSHKKRPDEVLEKAKELKVVLKRIPPKKLDHVGIDVSKTLETKIRDPSAVKTNFQQKPQPDIYEIVSSDEVISIAKPKSKPATKKFFTEKTKTIQKTRETQKRTNKKSVNNSIGRMDIFDFPKSKADKENKKRRTNKKSKNNKILIDLDITNELNKLDATNSVPRKRRLYSKMRMDDIEFDHKNDHVSPKKIQKTNPIANEDEMLNETFETEKIHRNEVTHAQKIEKIKKHMEEINQKEKTTQSSQNNEANANRKKPVNLLRETDMVGKKNNTTFQSIDKNLNYSYSQFVKTRNNGKSTNTNIVLSQTKKSSFRSSVNDGKKSMSKAENNMNDTGPIDYGLCSDAFNALKNDDSNVASRLFHQKDGSKIGSIEKTESYKQIMKQQIKGAIEKYIDDIKKRAVDLEDTISDILSK